MRFLIAAIFFLLFSQQGSANGETDSKFEEANAAFLAEKFSEAITQYRALCPQLENCPGVLNNIAAAYYHNADIAHAKIFLAMAEEQAPRNIFIKNNLRLLYPNEGAAAEKSSFPHLNVQELNILFSIAVICIFLAHLFMLIRSEKKSQIFSFALSMIVLAGAYVYAQNHRLYAITKEELSELYSGQGSNYMKIAELKLGSKVYVERDDSGWVLVSDESGVKGWLEKRALLFPDKSSFLNSEPHEQTKAHF